MTHEDWTQAQYSVLGSVLIEPSLAPKVIHETRKTDYSGSCQTVYLAMCQLFQEGKPVDIVAVAAALGDTYRKFLVQLMEITPSVANLDYYISLIREQSKVIAVRDIAGQLLTVEESEQIRDLLDQANNMMANRMNKAVVTTSDALKTFMERAATEKQYLSWPIDVMNERLYCEPGDFIILGGRPSAGKSAFALQCAEHWARRMRVGFFSLETSSEKLFDRMMASRAGLSMADIKRNQISEKQWEDIALQSTDIVGLQLEFVPAAGMSPADVKSVTVMRGYELIIIDYVQLLEASGKNRTEQVTNISLALHRMAQDMKVTIVGLSQLKRKGEKSTLDSSDLRESGQLEQDADVVLLLQLVDESKPGGQRELLFSKNKEGTTPKTTLDFDGNHQRFSKANRSGEMISKFIADGKRIQRQNRTLATTGQQMTMLPDNTPVPFAEEVRG